METVGCTDGCTVGPYVSPTLVGTPVVGTLVFGANVVGTLVVGAPVVVGPYVAPTLVGANEVGSLVVGAPVVGTLEVYAAAVGTPVVGTLVIGVLVSRVRLLEPLLNPLLLNPFGSAVGALLGTVVVKPSDEEFILDAHSLERSAACDFSTELAFAREPQHVSTWPMPSKPVVITVDQRVVAVNTGERPVKPGIGGTLLIERVWGEIRSGECVSDKNMKSNM